MGAALGKFDSSDSKKKGLTNVASNNLHRSKKSENFDKTLYFKIFDMKTETGYNFLWVTGVYFIYIIDYFHFVRGT